MNASTNARPGNDPALKLPLDLELQAIQLQRVALKLAISHLEAAREQAGFAATPRLVAAIRRALKSADGARRHMEGKLARKRL
jgi:hypothetical protein